MNKLVPCHSDNLLALSNEELAEHLMDLQGQHTKLSTWDVWSIRSGGKARYQKKLGYLQQTIDAAEKEYNERAGRTKALEVGHGLEAGDVVTHRTRPGLWVLQEVKPVAPSTLKVRIVPLALAHKVKPSYYYVSIANLTKHVPPSKKKWIEAAPKEPAFEATMLGTEVPPMREGDTVWWNGHTSLFTIWALGGCTDTGDRTVVLIFDGCVPAAGDKHTRQFHTTLSQLRYVKP